MQRFTAIGFALILAVIPCLCRAEAGARVELFSPQGTIKNVRQVTARFSEPMTTFGDPRGESPFDIACPEKGSGRWADVNNWVYDFDHDLPAGVACSFTLRDGLKALSGVPVGGERHFSFTTGGPVIVASRPGDGKTIDEDQIFILTLDGEADEASVLAKVRFSVEGIAEPLGIRIVKGIERAAVLKATGRQDAAKTMTIRCRQKFPGKATVKLIWGAGVAATTGVKTANDQIFTFTVRDRFVISFRCDQIKADAPCIPLLPMRLDFSAPVPANLARMIVMKAGKKVYKPELEGADEDGEGFVPAEGVVSGVRFKGPFPENTIFVIDLPKKLTDDAGRSPANRNRFPLKVSTDGFPPLAKFAAPFGILELNNDPALPVTLRNVEPGVKARQLDLEAPHQTIKGKERLLPLNREEQIIQWLRKVRTAQRTTPLLKSDGSEEFVIPKPNGSKAFEVVGIPLKKAGFHIVELESPLLGAALLEKRRPMYVSSAALVTNLSAHFKWGRESSLVWVTSLDQGLPVADAEVHVRDCQGTLHWQGKTDADGIARIAMKFPENLPFCSDRQKRDREEYSADNEQPMLWGMSRGLFVFARKQDDLTFVHSSWDRGIEKWRFNLPYAEFPQQIIAHTVFDRTLVRAGDTVHMKHFVRNHVMKGFDLRPVTDLPQVVQVVHRGSGQQYEFPLVWHPDNSAETTMTLPKGAELGFYDVSLVRNAPEQPNKAAKGGEEGGSWQSGFFRVEEFRVPLMKGVVEPPKDPAVNASAVEIDLFVSHLSGGGAGGAPVKLRTQVQPRSVTFDAYDEYTFANGTVVTGVVKEEAPDRVFDDAGDNVTSDVSLKKPTYRTQEFVLDKTGAFRAKIDNLPKLSFPQTLLAELEFRDPNGEIQTVTGRAPLWSSRLLVGIKPDSWSSSPDTLKFKAVVVDVKGNPVSGAQVAAELFSRRIYSHRKRLVGGFYSYEHVTETRSLGQVCKGTTDAAGILECSASSPVSGNVILQATVTDAEGASSSANRDVWVAGTGEWWFEAGDSDRIDLLPDKKSYNPGDSARFQVRSPFRSATVLVTVEREGVMDAFVRKITGKDPVIDVPIKGNHAPNVFVSALCVRGRVAGTRPTALFDPGKPAYRLGISEIKVGRQAHELKVHVSADSDAYKVRGTARIRIRVTRADGGALPRGAEVAVAAVDEGLLELMPNDSWRLLEAMMGRRGHEIDTSTAQSQVVGRRHYGLKALPAGGSGGMKSARELFDTLLTWKGRIKLDDRGEATLEIPLNDSLTSFSIVAVANAGTGLFGAGRTSIRTTQELMVLSGLPPMVRQGDRFTARFTVRNASSRETNLTVTARPSWSDGKGFAPVTLTLAPGAAQDVSWASEVPVGIETATWEARVQEENGAGSDSIKVSQRVLAAVPVRAYQTTVTQVDQAFDFDVNRPEGALKGRGSVEVALRPRLSDGLGGVVQYMQSYPYTCMEQMVSRAISLKDETLWSRIVTVLPAYLDNDGLVKYFPSPWLDGSPVLTAYLLTISKEAGLALPDNLLERMEQGLVTFIGGKIRRESTLRTADLSIRKLAAIEALSQWGKANAALLGSISVEPTLWPTSAVLDWLNILKRTQELPDRPKRLKEAEQIIRSRLNFQGTVMNFSTEQSDRLWWLMVSTDTNALRTLLSFMDEESWRPDIPRLVRGALARQRHGAWETTIANAWGVVALERFSKRFEATPVTGATAGALDGALQSVDWSKDQKGKTLSFSWPDKQDKLQLRHAGSGKPWATVMSLAAIPLKEPLYSGYRIKKTVIPVDQKDRSRWSRGDVARVRLEIEAQSDMTWVAVSDPVPAGTTILGSGLGRDSALMTEGEPSGAWPVYDERTFDAYRAYYDYLPKGKLVTEYTIRFNTEGKFRLPPTRVEALYAPELFGEAPNTLMSVGE